MAGGVAVEEVIAEVQPGRPVELARAAAGRGFDPEAVRALIRRDEQRRARLTVD